MKNKIQLIALAVGCMWIPATLMAQPQNKEGLAGTYTLEVKVPDMPWAISAFAICYPDGSMLQISNLPEPSFLGIGGGSHLYIGRGQWVPMGNHNFHVHFRTELGNKGSQLVDGIASLSEGGKVTGSAKAEFQNEGGAVVYRTNVTVSGERFSGPTSLTTR
jgi:hypothetical protein